LSTGLDDSPLISLPFPSLFLFRWAVDGTAAKLELLFASILALTFPNGLCFEPSPGALVEVLGLGEGRILDVGELVWLDRSVLLFGFPR